MLTHGSEMNEELESMASEAAGAKKYVVKLTAEERGI